MDDTTQPRNPERGSCSSQGQRFDASDADLARRLCALLSTAKNPHRTGQPWDLIRALAALLSPDRIEDVDATDAVDRDEDTLTVTIVRRFEEWSLSIHVAVAISALRPEFDVWEVSADELCRGEASLALCSDCVLSDGETDLAAELVERERECLAAREASERVERGEARHDG